MFDPDIEEAIERLTRRYLEGREPIFETRIALGKVVERTRRPAADDIFMLPERMVSEPPAVSTVESRAVSPSSRSCAGWSVRLTLDGWWDDVLRALNH